MSLTQLGVFVLGAVFLIISATALATALKVSRIPSSEYERVRRRTKRSVLNSLLGKIPTYAGSGIRDQEVDVGLGIRKGKLVEQGRLSRESVDTLLDKT
jgi:hypothetical protein